jgi:CheY-like chemotaxis protein
MPLRTEVLFVEDSAGDALLMAQILAEAFPTVKLTVARDGAQALAMLADLTFQPALIIIDLNLPLVSGFELLQHLPRPEIPMVVFSSSANPADQERAIALGSRDYFIKPAHREDYRDTVVAIIRLWAMPGTEARETASLGS